jgi:hypothetical protein
MAITAKAVETCQKWEMCRNVKRAGKGGIGKPRLIQMYGMPHMQRVVTKQAESWYYAKKKNVLNAPHAERCY